MVHIRYQKKTGFLRTFGYRIIPVIVIVSLIGISSCKKGTEYDGFADYTYNKLDVNSSILRDSIGLNPFLSEGYFSLSGKEQRLILHAGLNHIFEIKGIGLPESDNPNIEGLDSATRKIIFDCSYDNKFYGYPSAIKTDAGTLVVAEKRVAELTTNQFSDNIIISRQNNGDWSETDFFKFAPYGLGWNGTRPLIGKLPDGRIVMKGKGLLISNGDFQNWKHFPYAFQDLVNSGTLYHDYGPAMTYSSKFGLFFGTGYATVDTNKFSHASLFSVDVDNGKVSLVKYKWIPKVFRLSDSTYVYITSIAYPSFYSVEHNDLAAHKYDIVGLGISDFGKIYQYVYNYKEGDTFDSIRFQLKVTNIAGSVIRQSPVCIDYNPVSGRFEIMVSSPYELDLWSISTEDLLTSKVSRSNVAVWTKEAIILQRDIGIRAQGLYPVSSIIDETNQTQTVYFQSGLEYPARSGIFELTRTLDTKKLSEYINGYRAYLRAARY